MDSTYKRIKALCDAEGIGVTTLEMRLGFGRGSIGKMKKGGSTSPERLQKIADFFGVSVSFLVGKDEDGYYLDGERAAVVRTVVNNTKLWKLLVESLKATESDVDAATAMLEKLNAYAAALKGVEKRGRDNAES